MNEDFLYYIWQYMLFSTIYLRTTDQLKINIKKPGARNKNEGPDFLNAQIEIDGQLWAGNVEMHIKSSDWYLHKHEEDKNYDAVILHVVWKYDADVFTTSNNAIPTLELQNYVDKKLLNSFLNLYHNKSNLIPCGSQIKGVDTFLISNWLERLYFERLERKSRFIKKLLEQSSHDFEAVLFQLIAMNFGLKVNNEAFLQLANSVDFSVIRKVSFDESKLTAVLFGQAGFLNENIENTYHSVLKGEYDYLRHKYKLKAISKNNFQFFRMRPNNFPTIRIAQLSALFSSRQHLFSKLLEITKKEAFYALFAFKVNGFWQEHYTFETTSKKSAKKLTKSFIDLLLINTILPLKFVYLQYKKQLNEESLVALIQQIPSEKNAIIAMFSELHIKSRNALESQALIELKNNYCTKKRCLHCAIGNELLKR